MAPTEWALGTSDRSSQILDLDREPKLDGELAQDFSLDAAVRMRPDVFDRPKPGRPPQRVQSVTSKRLLIIDHADVEKPPIVWDKADGLMPWTQPEVGVEARPLEFPQNPVVDSRLWIPSPNRTDDFARARVSYEIRDGFQAWVGQDGFHGDRIGMPRQFDENDRIAIGLEWKF